MTLLIAVILLIHTEAEPLWLWAILTAVAWVGHLVWHAD